MVKTDDAAVLLAEALGCEPGMVEEALVSTGIGRLVEVGSAVTEMVLTPGGVTVSEEFPPIAFNKSIKNKRKRGSVRERKQRFRKPSDALTSDAKAKIAEAYGMSSYEVDVILADSDRTFLAKGKIARTRAGMKTWTASWFQNNAKSKQETADSLPLPGE